MIAYEVAPAGSASAAPWTARITGYAYEIRSAEDGLILAFHWHPAGRSLVTWPHLHVGASVPAVDLGKAHVPTMINLDNLAITRGGVVP